MCVQWGYREWKYQKMSEVCGLAYRFSGVQSSWGNYDREKRVCAVSMNQWATTGEKQDEEKPFTTTFDWFLELSFIKGFHWSIFSGLQISICGRQLPGSLHMPGSASWWDMLRGLPAGRTVSPHAGHRWLLYSVADPRSGQCLRWHQEAAKAQSCR